MRRTINILSLLFLSFVYSTDVFVSLDVNNLNYTSDVEIGGFQFSHDGCVESASGGEAGSAGFTVSASSTVVLGFSFTGGIIPAGCGILTNLDLDSEPTQFINIEFEDDSNNPFFSPEVNYFSE